MNIVPESDSVPLVIIHIPHASRRIPKDVRDFICLNEDELEVELDRLTDHYTDELFSVHGQDTVMLKYPVSRYVADPERFSDDSKEVMSKHGQGVIYTKTSEGKILREKPTSAQRDYLLNNYYLPHHKALEDLTELALKEYGYALIIDCHSFPSSPLPVDLEQSSNRPDICIGTDINHTSIELVRFLKTQFTQAGYSVAIDTPYAGTIVPARYYKTDNRVKSVMIEINRRLYLENEPKNISKKEPEFTQLHTIIGNTILKLTTLFSSY